MNIIRLQGDQRISYSRTTGTYATQLGVVQDPECLLDLTGKLV